MSVNEVKEETERCIVNLDFWLGQERGTRAQDMARAKEHLARLQARVDYLETERANERT